MKKGILRFPSLEHDPEFMKDYSDAVLALNGKGPYQKIIEGGGFAAFKEALNNPKKQTNLVARNLKEYLLKNRKLEK